MQELITFFNTDGTSISTDQYRAIKGIMLGWELDIIAADHGYMVNATRDEALSDEEWFYYTLMTAEKKLPYFEI